MDYPAILRDAGLTAIEVDGWETRGRPGSFTPVGLLGHHTASGRGSNPRGDRNVNLIVNGRSDLAGPLANFFHAREPIWYVVAAGRANHAGQGSQTVLDEVRTGTAHGPDARARGLHDEVVGNGWLLGLEVDNDGVGEPYSTAQVDSIMRGLAAICRAHGWSAGHLALHRWWTPRKIDWSYTGDFQAAVTALLNGDDMTPEEVRAIVADEIKKALNGPSEIRTRVDALSSKVGAVDSNGQARYVDLKATVESHGGGSGATPAQNADELARRLAT